MHYVYKYSKPKPKGDANSHQTEFKFQPVKNSTHTHLLLLTHGVCAQRGVSDAQKVCTRVAANNGENNKSEQITLTELSNFGKVNQGVCVNKKIRIRMLKTKRDATT